MNFIKLLQKNKEKEPETYETVYGSMVEKELKVNGYSLGRIQAIINNYLAEPDNEKYIKEFLDLQECRKYCKEKIKQNLS
jgi:hypothetical protein